MFLVEATFKSGISGKPTVIIPKRAHNFKEMEEVVTQFAKKKEINLIEVSRGGGSVLHIKLERDQDGQWQFKYC